MNMWKWHLLAARNSLHSSRYNLPRFIPPFLVVTRNASFQAPRPRFGSSTIRWLGIVGGVGLGLTSTAFSNPIICQSSPPPPDESKPQSAEGLIPSSPPTSVVNVYELSFGTVAGICSGVFIKKGAKAVAFFVGGIFVILQYFNSLSLIRVDWGRAASRFENLVYTEVNGIKRPPTVFSLWRWLVNFLTADFQPRASFLAGMMLGLRIG
ncbi:hypothetical protein K439DRAFT_1641101 [Ramaria rubella]|nr:hypothetical protein K439DRAFT_1641101 [Ramaria rubella]